MSFGTNQLRDRRPEKEKKWQPGRPPGGLYGCVFFFSGRRSHNLFVPRTHFWNVPWFQIPWFICTSFQHFPDVGEKIWDHFFGGSGVGLPLQSVIRICLVLPLKSTKNLYWFSISTCETQGGYNLVPPTVVGGWRKRKFSSRPSWRPRHILMTLLGSSPTPLPPKSGLRFSLRHRESVKRAHINQGVSAKKR